MLKSIRFVVAGAIVGALLGYVSQCAGGSCPLMCVWWRGAILGGIAGLAIHFAGAPAGPKPGPKDPE